jgi:hypothetical protein
MCSNQIMEATETQEAQPRTGSLRPETEDLLASLDERTRGKVISLSDYFTENIAKFMQGKLEDPSYNQIAQIVNGIAHLTNTHDAVNDSGIKISGSKKYDEMLNRLIQASKVLNAPEEDSST